MIRFWLGVLSGLAAGWAISALGLNRQQDDAVWAEERDFDIATQGHYDRLRVPPLPDRSHELRPLHEDKIENGWPTYDR